MKISMKKRKIGYTYGSVSGNFAFRQEKSIAFESTLERDLLTVLEFNSSVSDVIGQPITLEYINKNGRPVTYTPDFLVIFNEPDALLLKVQRKPFLIEVKPRKKLLKDFNKLKDRFKIAIKYARENDMVFKIFDESRIRTDYLKNILFLKRYKRLQYNKDDESDILTYVHAAGSIPVDIVIEYLFVTKEQKSIGLGHIWHLIVMKKLECDLRKPLNKGTIIWVNNEIFFGEDNE